MNDKGELHDRIRSLLQSGRSDEIISIGKPAVPYLIAALKDENWDVRCEAAEALKKIGFDKVPLDGRVLALLILKKTDEVVAIGEPAVPDLITALKAENWDVRCEAAGAIGKIGVNDKQFETIVRMLKEGETKEEREGAAMALGELKNVRAVPYLIVALKDEDSDVQKSAAGAIEKIAEKLVEKPIALVEQFIEKGEFEEALETIRSTTTTIMNFYKGAFRTARKKNKTMGKDRILLKQREELLKKLESLTNEVYARVKEKEGLPNPLDGKEPMEWKGAKRKDNKNQNAQKSKQTYSI